MTKAEKASELFANNFNCSQAVLTAFAPDFGLDEARKGELEPIIEGLTRRYLNEDKLNVFGKHPGYRKKPMTLPATGSDGDEKTTDWNDESVYSEQPFGEKIGDSAPFEKAIEKIVDSVMEGITKKKI